MVMQVSCLPCLKVATRPSRQPGLRSSTLQARRTYWFYEL